MFDRTASVSSIAVARRMVLARLDNVVGQPSTTRDFEPTSSSAHDHHVRPGLDRRSPPSSPDGVVARKASVWPCVLPWGVAVGGDHTEPCVFPLRRCFGHHEPGRVEDHRLGPRRTGARGDDRPGSAQSQRAGRRRRTARPWPHTHPGQRLGYEPPWPTMTAPQLLGCNGNPPGRALEDPGGNRPGSSHAPRRGPAPISKFRVNLCRRRPSPGLQR